MQADSRAASLANDDRRTLVRSWQAIDGSLELLRQPYWPREWFRQSTEAEMQQRAQAEAAVPSTRQIADQEAAGRTGRRRPAPDQPISCKERSASAVSRSTSVTPSRAAATTPAAMRRRRL